jgi:hypothetical protein
MKNHFLVLLFFVCYFSGYAQTTDFYGNKLVALNNVKTFSFNNDSEAQTMMNKICDKIGIPNNFTLKSVDNLKTCQAQYLDGKSYIFYGNNFLKKLINRFGFSESNLPELSQIDWPIMMVFCHEIAHHTSLHTTNPDIVRNIGYHKMELQADEYGARYMFRLGASLEQTKQAYLNLPVEDGTEHPGRQRRLDAVIKGWNYEQSIKGNGDPQKGGGAQLSYGKYYDDFNIDQTNNWYVAIGDRDSTRFFIDGGKMHLQNERVNKIFRVDFLPEILTRNFNFDSDFICSVSMKELSNNWESPGIMFYSTNKVENYFLVEQSKYKSKYSLYQRDVTSGNWIEIKYGYIKYSDDVSLGKNEFSWKKSEFNDIVIQKKGGMIQFYINNKLLDSIPTKEIVGGGKFGLFSEGGYQLFDDFKLEFMEPNRLSLNDMDLNTVDY